MYRSFYILDLLTHKLEHLASLRGLKRKIGNYKFKKKFGATSDVGEQDNRVLLGTSSDEDDCPGGNSL